MKKILKIYLLPAVILLYLSGCQPNEQNSGTQQSPSPCTPQTFSVEVNGYYEFSPNPAGASCESCLTPEYLKAARDKAVLNLNAVLSEICKGECSNNKTCRAVVKTQSEKNKLEEVKIGDNRMCRITYTITAGGECQCK